MQINNNDLINKLAGNMASSIGELQVQLAKAEMAIKELQEANTELHTKLAIYERDDKYDTTQPNTGNKQEPKVGQDSNSKAK